MSLARLVITAGDRFRVGQPRHRARLLGCGHCRLGLAVGTLHPSLSPHRALTWPITPAAKIFPAGHED